MTTKELERVGLFADTATFIHGQSYNMMHDGDRASLYKMTNNGRDFSLLVEIVGASQMRQLAVALNHAADLTEAAGVASQQQS